VSLRIGRFQVSPYLAMLYLGCVAGVYAGAAVADAEGLDASRFALVAAGLLVPAFAGARLWFVLQHLDRFRAEPRVAWRTSQGGASLYGGLVLGVVASIPVLALADVPFWSFWDAASVTMLVGLIFTRFGCAMNGCCGGRFGRFPTQLLEAGWAAIVLAGAIAVRGTLPDGALFAGVVAAYGAGRAVLEPTRESPRRVNVLFSLALVVAGCALLLSGPTG
jgi:phosphatidylglycerol:prolipoprotein diacylglycerol transferase